MVRLLHVPAVLTQWKEARYILDSKLGNSHKKCRSCEEEKNLLHPEVNVHLVAGHNTD
jgi:hypothetical protein